MSTRRDEPTDAIDAIDVARQEWARVHPDLDTTPMDVSGRLRMVAAALARATEPTVRAEGLTRPEFDVLSAVRRGRVPLTPTGIAAATLSSGAATTKRLDHLTGVGYLQRTPDERDGRVTRLSLTPRGPSSSTACCRRSSPPSTASPPTSTRTGSATSPPVCASCCAATASERRLVQRVARRASSMVTTPSR